MKIGNEVDAGSKPYWCGGTDMGLMRCRSERGPLLESIGSQLAVCPGKGYHSLSSLPLTQPGHSVHGTCLHMFCFLGNSTFTYCVICTDDVVCFDFKPFVIAVVRISKSREIPTTKVFVSIFYLCLSETCKDI